MAGDNASLRASAGEGGDHENEDREENPEHDPIQPFNVAGLRGAGCNMLMATGIERMSLSQQMCEQDCVRRSLGLLRHAGNSVRDLFRSGRLRRFYIHLVGAVRRNAFGQQTRHRPDISGDFPRLIFRNAIAKRRHAVRPALHDGGKNISRLAAVNPVAVHQGGPMPPPPCA